MLVDRGERREAFCQGFRNVNEV
ncbi:unnamed protein product [Calypogeia fissa]